MSENIKVDFSVLRSDKKKNFEGRIWSIKHWVKKMKEVQDIEWSKGQADFINAQFEMSERFYREFGKTLEGKNAIKRIIDMKKETK